VKLNLLDVPVYYINLDKSINRKQRYEERLSKYQDVQTERIAAITPHDIKKYKILPIYR
jgi:GR25 family glycosyltransferase involved in LPS biosynthesis